MKLRDRLSYLAEAWLLPLLVGVLLLADLGTGLNWLGSSPTELGGPAYAPARMLAPMPLYGAVFALAALVAATLVLSRWRSWLTGYSLQILGAFWAFWAVLFGTAAAGPRVSWLGAIQAALAMALHFLAGFAIAHRSASPGRE